MSKATRCFRVAFGVSLEQIHPKRPLHIINGIEMDFHKSADIIVAVLAEVELVADPFVIRRVELRQNFRPMVKIIGGTSAKGKTSELCFNIGGGGYVR